MVVIKKYGKKVTAILLAAVMALSLCSYMFMPQAMVKAEDNFPATGVHKGTLSHGSYHKLSGLKNSTGATVTEPDTITSKGVGRAGFCLSPGVSETTKTNAYTSANYTSGYGLKYYKAMIAFYYDCKNSYKTDAVRYAAQFFIWRTVILERNHKGNFSASAYNGSGFKSGFLASIKSIMGYSDATATALYNKAYDYIKNGANGAYNNQVALLKWTASKSQTMLTGKVYSDKSLKIKINKDLSESGTGISLAGTKYELHQGSKSGTKVGTFTLNKNGIDTITLKNDGAYDKTLKYVLYETKCVAGTVSNQEKSVIEFSIDWGKIKDGGNGGTVSLNKNGVDGSKPGWFITSSGFSADCQRQLVNKIPNITVSVNKQDRNTKKSLANGEFTIYAFNTDTGKYSTKVSAANNLGHAVTNPLVTGSNGSAVSAKIYYTSKNLGRFKIVETKPPAGYINSGEERTFNIKSGNGITQEAQTFSYIFYDESTPRDLYPITLKKVDEDTGTPIYDAKFTISVCKNTRTGKYPTLESLNSNDDIAWVETVEIEQEKDREGNLTNIFRTKKLETNRSYLIKEIKRPKGYASDGGSWGLGHGAFMLEHLSDADKLDVIYQLGFTLKDDGTVNVVTYNGGFVYSQSYKDPFVIHNNQSSGSVTVKKVDDKTGAPLQGASFELWEVSSERYNATGYIPTAEKGDVLSGSGETDENGKLVFGKLVADENGFHRENGTVVSEHFYMLVETKAPEGYRLPNYPVKRIYFRPNEVSWTTSSFENAFDKTYIMENEKATLDLNLHKVSTSRTGKESVALPGAKFALYKVEKIVTDNGALSDDQIVMEDSNNNGIDDNTERAISNVSDTVITSDSDNNADEEVGDTIDYSVLSNENYIDFDYSKITPLVSNITTDSNGNAKIPEILEAGGYVLVETQAPKNYLKADPQYIYIDSTTLYSTRSYDIEVKDEEFEALVKAVKIDSETGLTIKQAGVGFKIRNLDTNAYVVQTVDTYSEPEIEGAPHELIKSEETDTFYTDATGSITLPNVLAKGHYQLEEVVPPKGFFINTTPIKFTIDDDMDYYPDDPNKQFDYDENTRDVVITLECKDKPTTTYLKKTDISTGKEIPGGKYRVEDQEGNVIESWTGKGESHIITGLTAGEKYLFVEETAPDGYTIAEKIEFTVNTDGSPTYVEMKDDYIKLELSKQSVTSSKELPGAHLALYNNKNELVDSWVSADVPHRINRIKKGTYKLVETQAPKGFVVAADITFTVEEKSVVQKIVMNDDYAADLTIRKRDDDGKFLPDAEFKLEGEDGSVFHGITDEKGAATFGKDSEGYSTLKPQKYVLTEVKTKKGYTLLAEPVEIELPMILTKAEAEVCKADVSKAKWDEENQVYRFYTMTYEIQNDKLLTLPRTGMNNKIYAALAGAFMFILVVSLYLVRKKKKTK